MKNQPVSVIVISNNCKWELSKCIRGYDEHSYRDDNQIIFVDNGSTDGSRDIIAESNYKDDAIFLDDNYGGVAALNLGLNVVKNRIVGVYSSEDMVPGFNWDKYLCEDFRSDSYNLVRWVSVFPKEPGQLLLDGRRWWYHVPEIGNSPNNFSFEKFSKFSKNIIGVDEFIWDIPMYGHTSFCLKSVLDKIGKFKERQIAGKKILPNDVWAENDFLKRIEEYGIKSCMLNRVMYFHFTTRRESRLKKTMDKLLCGNYEFPYGSYKDINDWFFNCYLGGKNEYIKGV